jgi:lauroyl/myristoyl acyltransferase
LCAEKTHHARIRQNFNNKPEAIQKLADLESELAGHVDTSRVQRTRYMKLLLFSTLRWLERRLSVRSLYWIVVGYASGRSALKPKLSAVTLPALLVTETSGQTIRTTRVEYFLHQMLEHFPDRLAEPKWTSLCRIEGLDHVLQARRNGRPIVFAFLHAGPYRLSRFWLRAIGVPAATLVAGKAEQRTEFERLRDGLSPFSEIPTAFYLNQLRKVSEFLAAGNSLLVAIDHRAGKQMNVPIGEGWTFQMAVGAVRLAIRHRAELIPFVILHEGHWRFQIKLGRPVPANYLAGEVDLIHAGKHLLDEMLPHFRTHPRQCTARMVSHLLPTPLTNPDGRSPE